MLTHFYKFFLKYFSALKNIDESLFFVVIVIEKSNMYLTIVYIDMIYFKNESIFAAERISKKPDEDGIIFDLVLVL